MKLSRYDFSLFIPYSMMVFIPFVAFLWFFLSSSEDGYQFKRVYDAMVLSSIAGMACLFFYRRDKEIPLSPFAVVVLSFGLIFSAGFFSAYFNQGFDEFYPAVFLREIKPIIYFLFAYLWVITFKPVQIVVFDQFARVLSVLIIVIALYGNLVYGVGFRPALADESNYDNFLVLLGVFSYLYNRLSLEKEGKIDGWIILYSVAVLVSLSKMGSLVFFVLLTWVAALYIKKIGWGKAFSLFVLALLVLVLVWAARFPNSEQPSGQSWTSGDEYCLTGNDDSFVAQKILSRICSIDRYKMWGNALDVFSQSTIKERLFGHPAGWSISDNHSGIEMFVKHQVERKLSATGLHAFNYHGMWLRILSTYGLLGLLIFVAAIVCYLGLNRWSFLLLVFIALQGAVMGVFYLSVVSPVLLLFMYSFKSQNQKLLHARSSA